MLAFLEDFGLSILAFFEVIGGIVGLFYETVLSLAAGFSRFTLTVNQMSILGINSLPIVILTVGFGGMVIALELALQAVKFGFSRWVGAGVAITMARELAPILTAVVFSGRAGSAITAEIGSMRVTEQVDALVAMATSPVNYLVVPRFLACLAMVPLLTVFGNLAGILGGAAVAFLNAGVPYNVFFDSIRDNVVLHDFTGGLFKALVFGGEIAMVACHQGLETRGGAAGVGTSTTGSVVYSIIIVFITNYFMSAVLFTEMFTRPAGTADPVLTPSPDQVVVTQDLTVRFSGRAVLNNVNLVVPKGETLALMGLSGVGKSTTLRCIMGFQKQTSGYIYLFGRRQDSYGKKELSELRKRIAMVFQLPALFDSMTVGDNVAFALREQKHMREEDVLRIVAEKLKLVDLEGTEHLMPSQMSGGMQKRVSVARAITTDPELILYDEPTTGLDPIISNVINELILSLKRRLGSSAIVVTHDLKSAYMIADKIAFLYDGQIVEEGTPDQFQKSTNPYVVQFREGSTKGPIQV